MLVMCVQFGSLIHDDAV